MPQFLSRPLAALGLAALILTFAACDSGDPEPAEQTIVELAQDTPELSTLVQALQAADLVATLNGAGPFTVFAPSDAAFEALLADLGVTADELLARDDLGEILTYHVVSGAAFSADLTDGQLLETLQGDTLEVDIDGGVISLVGATNAVTVTTADVEASNGVVHIVDGVLLPGGDDNPFAEAEANVGSWTFVDVEGARCRDGSDTGFGIRLKEGADNLLIYLEGGGACFNAETCATNPSSFGETEFNVLVAQRGDAAIFSTGADNPVGDWNMVYVPYCTGDVHGGSRPDAMLPDVSGAQQFVGHLNVGRYLDLLAPYLGDPDRVLLTGASAGGFGAFINFATVADRFDASEPYLLNDSGPIFFADDVYSPQLAAAFNAAWDLEAAFPADAAPLFEPDGLEDTYAYYVDRYPDASFGLSSYLQDQTIRYFFGFGQPDGEVSGEEFEAGLRDLDGQLPESWGVYYAEGADHTFIGVPDRYFGTSAGVAMNDWLADLLDGNPTDVVPPEARVATR